MPEARISVRVQPRSRRAVVEVTEAGGITVRVSAPPEGGKANAQVIEAIAHALGVSPSSVDIVRGHGARDKVVAAEGVTQEEALGRLRG